MRILVIEDEEALAEMIRESLQKEKYLVDVALDGEEGMFLIRDGIYDLVILDVMLPHMDGYEIMEAVRKDGIKVQVLMLTAKTEIEDRVHGLDIGADDYMTKPFAMKELLARVRARVRRTNESQINELSYCDIKLDQSTFALYNKMNGQSVTLGNKEFLLMEYLMRNTSQVVSKEQISNKIWGCDQDVDYNKIEVYVSFLRKKLSFLNAKANIKTMRGLGYRLVGAEDTHD